MFKETHAAEQGFIVGLAAHEVFEEHCGMLGAATREYFVAKTSSGLLVEDAVGFETAEDVGIQHLGPLVAVLAAGVSATKDVAEVGGRATTWHTRYEIGHGRSLNGFCSG